MMEITLNLPEELAKNFGNDAHAIERAALRAQSNLTRTLAKLQAAGFVMMKAAGRRKTPSVTVKKIVVEIDPCSDRDRLQVA